MEKIDYSEEIYNFDVLGSGGFASVYYDKKRNKAIKVYREEEFKDKEEMLETLQNEEKIAQYSFLEELGVILPKEKVYVNEEYLGIAMRLVNGFSLLEYKLKYQYAKTYENKKAKINFFSYIKAYFELKNNIKKISEKNMKFCDLNDGNIMWDYDLNKLVIIDTQLLEERKDKTSHELKRENLYELERWANTKSLYKNKVFTLKLKNKGFVPKKEEI